MRKTAWHFKTKSGKGGCMVLPYADTEAEALAECVASLGDQIIRVY